MWGDFMCTRFYIEPDNEETRELIDIARRSKLADAFMKTGSAIQTQGEIKPTNVVPVIATGKGGKKSAFPMRWGFQIPNRSLLVNTRSETAGEKPSFREAWQQHRCVIPASYYFEWEHLIGSSGQKKVGDKFMLQPKNETMTWLAGTYRMEEGLPVFTVLTREPSEGIAHIHDRMPLILPKHIIDQWIHPDSNPASLLQYALTNVLAERVEKQDSQMRIM